MIHTMAPDVNYTVIYRPGVQAPVYGPDGLNGSRAAYAPTPGQGSSFVIQTADWIEDFLGHLALP